MWVSMKLTLTENYVGLYDIIYRKVVCLYFDFRPIIRFSYLIAKSLKKFTKDFANDRSPVCRILTMFDTEECIGLQGCYVSTFYTLLTLLISYVLDSTQVLAVNLLLSRIL